MNGKRFVMIASVLFLGACGTPTLTSQTVISETEDGRYRSVASLAHTPSGPVITQNILIDTTTGQSVSASGSGPSTNQVVAGALANVPSAMIMGGAQVGAAYVGRPKINGGGAPAIAISGAQAATQTAVGAMTFK